MIRYSSLNEFLHEVRTHKPKVIRITRVVEHTNEVNPEGSFFLCASFLVEPAEIHELHLLLGQAHVESNDYDRLVAKVAQEATLLTLDIRNVSPATAIRGGRYSEVIRNGVS